MKDSAREHLENLIEFCSPVYSEEEPGLLRAMWECVQMGSDQSEVVDPLAFGLLVHLEEALTTEHTRAEVLRSARRCLQELSGRLEDLVSTIEDQS